MNASAGFKIRRFTAFSRIDIGNGRRGIWRATDNRRPELRLLQLLHVLQQISATKEPLLYVRYSLLYVQASSSLVHMCLCDAHLNGLTKHMIKLA